MAAEIDWDKCMEELQSLPAAEEIRDAIKKIPLSTTLSIDVKVESHPPRISLDITPLSFPQEDELKTIQPILAEIVGGVAQIYGLRAYSGLYFPAEKGQRRKFSSNLPGFTLKPDYTKYRK